MINNITLGAGDLMSIDGCDEIIHLPMIPIQRVPFDYALVWQAKSSRPAVMPVHKQLGPEKFAAWGALEGPVGEELFPAV